MFVRPLLVNGLGVYLTILLSSFLSLRENSLSIPRARSHSFFVSVYYPLLLLFLPFLTFLHTSCLILLVFQSGEKWPESRTDDPRTDEEEASVRKQKH